VILIKKLITNKIENLPYNNYTVIIGSSPSKGARSPSLWNAAFQRYKIKNHMIPLDTNNNNIFKLLNTLEKDKNFIGGCVTIPHKETVFKWLKGKVTRTSKKIGAVNCLFRDRKGKLRGTNTDGEAALKSYKNKFGSIKNKKIILIGAGGAGKAVASYFVSEISRRKNLVITGRSKSSEKYSKKIGSTWLHNKNIVNLDLEKFDTIINCTSLGFGKLINKSPISFNKLKNNKKKLNIFDIIYKPKFTKLILDAKKKNFKTLNGLDMNLRQAVLAFGYVMKKTKQNKLTLKYMSSI
jgi:shikimate dehydrogenase